MPKNVTFRNGLESSYLHSFCAVNIKHQLFTVLHAADAVGDDEAMAPEPAGEETAGEQGLAREGGKW